MTLHVTDHAILRFLERVHGLELEKLRAELRGKAERAMVAAQSIGGGQYTILVDGVKFRCVNDRIVTVVTGDPERDAT
jgi:predicted butyrate kinase (DUF1464 family)